jgi:poly-gamma-glutamate capsule biosynthesis protein CapA/YwtB (metallophosphatase superfamily)
MSAKNLTMLAVGDIILHQVPAEPLFELVAPVLRTGDVVVGQEEMLFTSRPNNTYADMFYQSDACNPSNMNVFPASGFNVLHLAGNHTWDFGAPGIEDTVTGLRNLGIAICGAGMNIYEATRSAIIERKGTRFGFLSYNCVGPTGSWATSEKPGCAYVHILTAYELEVPCPASYPVAYSFAEPHSLKAMVNDIQELRPLCDILTVHLHKGLGNIPGKIAMYEQQVSYAAIDAGADIVLAEHAHLLKGIEMYKGKAIFHGLGDFVKTPKFRPSSQIPERARESLRRHGGPFLFGPNGKETSFPFPEVDYTIIAKCYVDNGKISRLSYLPCLINAKRQPEILENDDRGQRLFDYMDNITKGADLNVRYEWEGNEVVVQEK